MRYGRRARGGALAGAVVAALAGTGCGGTGGADPAEVTVFAAATLTEVFTRLGADFEVAHPGTTVRLHFAASSTLAHQINAGAPADVFASAHPDPMASVATGATPVTFARADLVIAVAEGNPLGVTGLADLTRPEVTTAVCAAPVPCGIAAAQALAAGGVDLTPATLERDVKAALAKVILGEVDAALVYRADVGAAAGVVGIDFRESAAAVNDLQIAVLEEARDPVLAAAFVAYLRSEAAVAALTEAGYLEPTP